jgi:hypothetical protein
MIYSQILLPRPHLDFLNYFIDLFEIFDIKATVLGYVFYCMLLHILEKFTFCYLYCVDYKSKQFGSRSDDEKMMSYQEPNCLNYNVLSTDL